MGKEGQLWDDSALLNAFDQAISKYKKMHGKGYKDTSNDATKHVSSNTTELVADTQINDSNQAVDDGNSDDSQVTPEVEEPGSLGSVNEKEVPNFQIANEHALGSNSFPPQDQPQNYYSSMDIDEYNQLYKQYYELEEQRQKILQKMQHLTGENYSYSGEASVPESQWGTNSATQGHQSSIQLPCGTVVVTCCPSAGQCSVASSCPSAGQCSVASSCPLACPVTAAAGTLCNCSSAAEGIGEKVEVEDADVVKTALGAAERALSTLKDQTSGSKEKNKFCNVTGKSTSSDTDFSTVLNAWYSAGFYTGKYLTERSLSRK